MEGTNYIRVMKHVYDVIISGETILTTVTNQENAITEWINAVKADRTSSVCRIGFEVELSNDFGPIGSVQLCVGRRCLIIQHVRGYPWPWPPSLDQFLSDSNNIVAGVNMEDKLNKLRQQIPSIGVDLKRSVVELLVDLPWLLNSKKKVFSKYGLGRAGSTVETAWGGRTRMLSDEQVQYACLDAFLNLQAAVGIILRAPTQS